MKTPKHSKYSERPVNQDDELELICAKAIIGDMPVSWSESGWEKYQTILTLINKEKAKAELVGRIDEVKKLQKRGHTAERASVPNTDKELYFDRRPNWVTISAPIFYCWAVTITDRLAQLEAQLSQDRRSNADQ